MQQFKLNSGDKVGVISTARAIGMPELELVDNLIRQWSFTPVYGSTIGATSDQFAGSDSMRTADLQRMLDDENIRAILFARGGYGTIRIIEHIDFSKFVKHPKLLCGYSDMTILHSHLTDKLGLPAVHSTMPFSFQRNTPQALESLRNILKGELPFYNVPSHPLNIHGEAEGELIGGNLSILYSLLGTRYGFGTAHKILFLEDIDEYLYHIDRMMMSFKLSGKLQNLSGIVLGDFTDMKDNKVPFGITAEEIILRYAEPLGIPVCCKFPAGHIDDNRALVLGKKIRLSVQPHSVSLRYI